MSLSGVGAHHQNGVAERAIQTVMWKALTMMIHLQLFWPDHFAVNLWSFAVTYATWIHNHTPADDLGFAPMELFSGMRLNCHDLRRVCVFECPAFILDPRLQDGFKIPKSEPRARLRQFLGFESSNSTTIGTTRNLRTGYISLQYHVVSSQSLDSEEYWNDLCLNHQDHYVEDFYDIEQIPPLYESY
jgi:hypothetical protein